MYLRKIFLLTLSVGLSTSALADDDASGWQFELTPYLWLPTIAGDLNYEGSGDGSPNVSVGPTDWLDLLNGVAFIKGGARKERFSLTADFIYLSLKSDKDRVESVDGSISGPGGDTIPIGVDANLQTTTEFDGLVVTLMAGYTVKESKTAPMDIIVGVRYLGVDIQTDWDLTVDITTPDDEVVLPAQGSIGQDTDFWDGVVGLRGHVMLGESRWAVPYYFDIGAGSSKLTWQATAGISYSYGWGDLVMVYRHLDYDEDSSGLLQNLSLSGPAFGATFRFGN